MNTTIFKEKHSLEKRKKMSKSILSKHVDMIPIIIERASNADPSLPILDKKKFLIPSTMTVNMVLRMIKDRLVIDSKKSLYIMFDGKIVSSFSENMAEIYNRHKDKDDGFLYGYYMTENTFG
jgi:GABA(A) receptor-associated protein